MRYPASPRTRRTPFGGRSDGKRPVRPTTVQVRPGALAAQRAQLNTQQASLAPPNPADLASLAARQAALAGRTPFGGQDSGKPVVASAVRSQTIVGPKTVDEARNRSPFSRRYDATNKQGRSSRRDLVRNLVGENWEALHKAQGLSGKQLGSLVSQRRELRSQLPEVGGQQDAQIREQLAAIKAQLKPALSERREYLQGLFQNRARQNSGVSNRSLAPGVNEPVSNRRNGFQGYPRVSGNRQVVGERGGRGRPGSELLRRGRRYQGRSSYPR
jgi:hypothetical protein